jgi:hypothetical protein
MFWRSRHQIRGEKIVSSDEFQKYEAACAIIKERNAQLLADFQKSLLEKNLAAKTTKEHVQNVDFYINTYLLYEEAIPAKEGAGQITMFLGYWFPRKALWASPSSVKSIAASLKKFYTFMRENGEIEAEDLEEFKEAIKEDMEEWLDAVDR